MSTLTTAGNLPRRPPGHDYAAEVRKRLGPVHMCRMDLLGQDSEARRPYDVVEGIALVDITGLLVNERFWWDETSYVQIADEVRLAAEDGGVSGILLRINSPGGETAKSFETARIIREASAEKPVWAAADPNAYSAAYLMATAAQRIYVAPETGGVGSIGVFSEHWDFSGLLEKQGINVTLISAGEGKTDGNPYEPLSDSARETITAEVERLYGLFVGAVATSRGMSEEQVRGMGAALFNGASQAIGAGLADRAGASAEAWVDMASFVSESPAQISVSSTTSAASAAVNSTKEGNMPEEKKADAATAAPVDVGKITADAEAAGAAKAKAATQEVMDLCALAGQPERAQEFLKAGTKPAEVRKALAEKKAEESETEPIHSHILATTGHAGKDAPRLVDRMEVMLKKRGLTPKAEVA